LGAGDAWRSGAAVSLVPAARKTAGTSQTGCWFSSSSTTRPRRFSQDHSTATRDVKRSQSAALRDQRAEEGIFAAQSDAVEVADDDTV
jgi:hypothetical protein